MCPQMQKYRFEKVFLQIDFLSKQKNTPGENSRGVVKSYKIVLETNINVY